MRDKIDKAAPHFLSVLADSSSMFSSAYIMNGGCDVEC